MGFVKHTIPVPLRKFKKPLRVIKPNPLDPTWTFPYASRAYMQKIEAYFLSFPRVNNWHTHKNTRALDQMTAKRLRKITKWPSVPEKYRPRVEKYFQRKLAEWLAEHGSITPGKLRSLRMCAASFGRNVCTGRVYLTKFRYDRKKRLWYAYQEWEKKQALNKLPPTQSKVLDVF